MACNLCREWNKRLSADQAQKLYDQAVKLEQEFAEYFTGILPALICTDVQSAYRSSNNPKNYYNV